MFLTGKGIGAPSPVAAIVTGHRFIRDHLFVGVGTKTNAGGCRVGRRNRIVFSMNECPAFFSIYKPHFMLKISISF